MSEYGNLISQSFGQANPALPPVVGNIDEDPDRAQRALDLEQATGVPSTSIYGDLDEFERQHKAMVASDIVANNPHLSDFVQSHPMVPKLANDDYGNLDSVSQKVSTMGWLWQTAKNSVRALLNPPEAFQEGFGEAPVGMALFSPEDVHNHPFLASLGAAAATIPELAARTFGGVTQEAATELLGEERGRQVAQVLMDPGTAATLESMGPVGEVAGGALSALDRFRPAATFLRNGKTPPPTILPEYDKFLADQNSTGLDQLKDATAEAQKSLLRERNPDLFAQFISQHTDAEIGISGDAVAALYGDKPPTPDDGLLGWVPGIEDKLGLARETGADVNIPLSDWLANSDVSSKLMQDLGDDIRMQPDGITANEAKGAGEAETGAEAEPQVAQEPTIPLPDPIPATRAGASLEPLLSVGDRKLKLDRLAGAEDSRFGPAQGFHDFSINDENGNPVGTLNLSEQQGGKQLYVEMINGLNGLGPRDFGPALMRDLMRQLKTEFPNAETITGHRVSGAREKAGVEMTAAAPVVKLDRLDDVDSFRRVLEGGQWERFSPSIQGYVKPDALQSARDSQIIQAVHDELDRIAPQKTAVQVVSSIKAKADRIEGQRAGEGIKVGGAYLRFRDTYPIILAALDSGDTLGTARHEAIHHLRQYGFFNPEEWSTLEAQALAGGWLKKYRIDKRYPTGSPSLKLEEAVAEAFTDWNKGQDTLKDRAAQVAQVPSPLDAIFQKMKDFFDRIKARIGDLIGKDPTWEDIFKRVDTGEVGGREGTSPLDPRSFDEKLSVEPPEGGSRVFERASALGMTVDQFKRYDELMQKRHAEDIAAATKRAMEEKGREQTKQWKEDRKALRQEVAADIKQRPDVAADLFFGSGELYGKKVPLGSVKMDASALTDAQKAGLPRNYYGEHGMHPDDVAGLFGYGSGDTMVERMIAYNAAKLTAGRMSAKDFVSRVTDMETDRQMQLRHGVLENNILDAVKEQVSGETQQNILHEETVALGMKAGQAPLDKATIQAQLREAFAKMPIGSVSSDAYMKAAGKAGRAAEFGLLNNDPASAFRAKQQQYYATVIANEAAKLEKDLARFNKLAKRYAKPFNPKAGVVDAKYSLFNRDILSMVERPYGMSVQGLAEAIGRSGYSDLRDFVTKQNEFYGIAGIELPVADFLQEPNFHKPFAELTVDEARQVMDSVKALDRFGRDIEKVNVAGAKQERRDLISQMTKQLQDKFAPISHEASKQPGALRHYIAASTKPETFFARFDGRDPYGVFTKTFALPAAKASNYEAKLAREFSKAYGDAGKITDPKKLVSSPFFELDAQGKRTSTRIANFTRENLHAVIANMGNEYNWRVLAKGWDIDPDALWKWVEANTTAEDIDRAQAVGDVFKRAKVLDDNVHDAIYGVAPESIPVRPFTMHGKQYAGWYHPIIYDPIRSKLSKIQGVDPTEGSKYQNFWPSVASGHTIRRTGNVDVISLSNDMVPIKLNQVLHSIAYREFVHDTAKITRDNAFRHAITERYGPEYVEQIDHWINSIAGAASYNSQALATATNLSNRIRQNVISTYIAFSPTTVEKHGLTAAKFSMQEVGHRRFARVFGEVAADSFMHAVNDLFGRSPGLGETLWSFAVRNSEELQRRDRNYLETFTGQQDQITGKSSWRNWIVEKGSKAVAFSDMLSAVPTWLARYREALEETGGDVGAATEQGDRAVRRAHGSTAISNRSMLESGKGPLAPWMTSIYGFFGTDLQRQMEIAHDVNDAYKLGRDGELRKAFSAIPNISSNVFTYVIWTGLVEEAVASQFTEDHRSLLSKALSTTLGPLANTWVGLRDLVYSVQHNTDPTPGLMSSPMHDAAQLIRDAKKHQPFAAKNAGKLVQDAITVFGDATGKGPRHIGTAARYGIDVWTGHQKPKTAGDVYRGVVTGQQTLRKGH